MTRTLFFCIAEEAKTVSQSVFNESRLEADRDYQFVPTALHESSTEPEDPPLLYYLVESKDCPSTGEGLRTRLQDGESFESDFINASKEECQDWTLDKWLQPVKFNFIEQSIIAIADERRSRPLPPKGNTWYDFRIHHNAAQLFHASLLFTESDSFFPNYFGRPEKFTDDTGVFNVLKAWKHTEEESSDKDEQRTYDDNYE
ncbi:uncharacterized protein P174DRAFT_459731 [Aspergillus novofumigatus IBT 16806]|uniref:Uncharacterized protein n=1 Tax=Aspergillus novofumigatus (strain IBT 16806) TaxID=1392255 RepID=A0A2I1C7F1_ASPN1|nr:uncharacterized protein P174DRAFT_459731 [Aspergillus novofumigatus IBT 16806]PKX93562.1 hypothetical protein P174DRAFT_459731 [Aspergillus novofumigatus IBT 16806]